MYKRQTYTLAEIDGPGAIQHIWMTPTGNWKFSIIRFYWDDEDTPSVEVPVGDFFAMGWNEYAPPVSYTHLDVYKRQPKDYSQPGSNGR